MQTISKPRPNVRANVHRRLVQTASLGGARPKATVRDENGQFWLVKPRIASDFADIPRFEHACQQWGAGSGLHFARTELHLEKDGRNAVRVLRFDRNGQHRHMCLSAASMLQAEYASVACLDEAWRQTLHERLQHNATMLGSEAAWQ